jgi:hypothetical protein
MSEGIDLAPDFDFQASSRAAEEAALAAEGAEPAEGEAEGSDQPDPYSFYRNEDDAPAEAEAAPADGERARNPDGTFAAKERPADEAEPAADDFYVGRYRDREEAERGISEKDRTTNEALQRAADAERRAAELEAYYNQQAAQQQQQPTVPQNFESILEDDPVRAAQIAYDARDPYAWKAARDAWDELSPGTPDTWLNQRRLEERQAYFEQQQQQANAPLMEQIAERQTNEIVRNFNERNPWFQGITDDELVPVIQSNEQLARMAGTGDPSQIAQVLFIAGHEVLQQRLARDGQTQSTIQDIARTQAQEAQRAREDAFVASSQTATAQEPATVAEREAQRMEERVRATQSKWESGLEYGAPRR